MGTKKGLLTSVILIFLVLNLLFVLASNHESVTGTGEDSPQKNTEQKEFFKNDLNVSHNDVEVRSKEGVRIYLLDGENPSVKVGNKTFENIRPSEGGGSGISFDSEGNIQTASFKTKEGGGNYTISGTSFSVPGDSKVEYLNESLSLPHDAKILSINSSKMKGKRIKTQIRKDIPKEAFEGKGDESGDSRLAKGYYDPKDLESANSKILLPDGRALRGSARIKEKGILIEEKSVLYDERQDVKEYIVNSGQSISTTEGSEVLLANKDRNMSGYGGSWVKMNESRIKAKSRGKDSFSIALSDESSLFENREVKGNKNSNLATDFSVINGAEMEIRRRQGKPFLVEKSSESEGTIIVGTGNKDVRIFDKQIMVNRVKEAVHETTTVNMVIKGDPNSSRELRVSEDGSVVFHPSGREIKPRTKTVEENFAKEEIRENLEEETSE